MIPQRESAPEQRREMALRAVSNGVDTENDIYASFIRWTDEKWWK